jgi:SpoVK/Ycf46/Vps4 family AAA+-type ATPase
MVSKYIGETEKNLERVFNAAEGGGVVLVFDEADALFGKRTGVGDAKDRYANIETSYLLQRLETYDGLVVLTSNFPGNIDHAFMRRIHVSVEFPMPGVAERRAIWAASFPPGAPVGDIDFDGLAARFEFAGGSIRAAVLTAAFAAADEDVPVSMSHVAHGVRREFLKLGRIVNMSGL